MQKQAVANFSAGPAMVPRTVLEQAQSEFIDWYHGMSVVEISHRTPPVLEMQANLEKLLRELLKIPDDFCVLMMQGGARGQFSAVAMNLLPPQATAYYALTGYWGKLAAKVASDFGAIEQVVFETPQAIESWQLPKRAAYVHVTDNETIEGIELPILPNVSCPIVTDVTSNILSRDIDWDKVHCAYASAQKNLGIAGATYVIIKKELIDKAQKVIPDILSYASALEADSMLNTPPVFAWYMTEKVLRWVKDQGGVAQMASMAQQRSQALYETIDASSYYQNNIASAWRSRMNVPFQLPNPELFFEKAKEAGFYFLEGHRSTGGARASVYNAMPLASILSFIEFMKDFEKRNG